jgi:hypothetical protein
LVGHVQLNLIGFFTCFGFSALATLSPFNGFAWDLAVAKVDLLAGSGVSPVVPFNFEGDPSTWRIGLVCLFLVSGGFKRRR